MGVYHGKSPWEFTVGGRHVSLLWEVTLGVYHRSLLRKVTAGVYRGRFNDLIGCGGDT